MIKNNKNVLQLVDVKPPSTLIIIPHNLGEEQTPNNLSMVAEFSTFKGILKSLLFMLQANFGRIPDCLNFQVTAKYQVVLLPMFTISLPQKITAIDLDNFLSVI